MFTYVDDISIPVNERLGEPWVTRECSFSQFFALNIPWISTEFLTCKHNRLNSGYIDLIWIEQVSSSKFLRIMLDQEGKHIDHGFVNHVKSRAVILVPIGRARKSSSMETHEGILDIDGEVVLTGSIRIESHAGLCRLVVPSWLNEDENTSSSGSHIAVCDFSQPE